MRAAKYIVIDTETGGVDPCNSSLLTVYFGVLDDQFSLIDDLYLFCCPDIPLVHEEALKVNGINIEEHKLMAISYSEAFCRLSQFLNKYSTLDKLIPIGHNLSFDLQFIQTYLMTSAEWQKYVSYKGLDTAIITNFLNIALDFSLPTSLNKLASDVVREDFVHHDARQDALMTVKVLKKLASITGDKNDQSLYKRKY